MTSCREKLHDRAACGTASLVVPRVRCHEVLSVLEDPLRGLKWGIRCLKGVCIGP